MEFLNPLALAALAAAAIPLIIHLFNFRRPRKVDFSSLEFVRELQKSTMQRVRIKQWLLLLLRMLAIACLVIAFARPTLTGDLAGAVGGDARSSVAVVIDNSPSMTLRDAGGEYFRQAKDVATALLDELSSGDEIFVVGTGNEPGSAERFTNVGSAIRAIENLEPATSSRSASDAVVRAGRLLSEAVHLNREIYVLSDLQQSTFADSVVSRLDAGIRTYLLPVGDRLHSNVAVTDVQVESRIIEAGQPVRITATLLNYGTEGLEDYVTSLFLEGERLAQATVDVPPGVPTTVTLTASPQGRGWLAGTVHIEGDAFEFDNERHFTLHVPERRRVLVVRGEGQRSDYVELALSPEIGRDGVAFDVTIIEETGLAAAGLAGFDAVFLLGPRSLSSGEIAALGRYVAGGGGLLVSPSADAAAEEYNALLAELGGGRVSGFSGSLGSRRSIASFESVDLEHPLFEGVFGRRELSGDVRVESPEIYHGLNYSPGGGGELTLIELTNGFPFLQEIRHELGVALLLSVAPDDRWSDFPVRGLFIPLLYRSMYYLSASESVSGEQLVAARDAEIRLPRLSGATELRVIGPDASEYVPEQRNLVGALLLSLDGDALAERGVYDIRADQRTVRRFAVNLDAAESDLRPLDEREARARLEDAIGQEVALVDVRGDRPADIISSVLEERTGVELWKHFLVLALLFLIGEMVVAKQWRPESVPA